MPSNQPCPSRYDPVRQTLTRIAKALQPQQALSHAQLLEFLSRSLGFNDLQHLRETLGRAKPERRFDALTTFRAAETWSAAIAPELKVPLNCIRDAVARARMHDVVPIDICGPSQGNVWNDFMFVSAWQLEENPDQVFSKAGQFLELAAANGDSRAMRALAEGSDEARYTSRRKSRWAYVQWARSTEPGCAEAALLLALEAESKSLAYWGKQTARAISAQKLHLSAAFTSATRAVECLIHDPQSDAKLGAAIHAMLGRIHANRRATQYSLPRAIASFARVADEPRDYYPSPDVFYQDSPVRDGVWWDITALRRILVESDQPESVLDRLAPMIEAIAPDAALAFDTERQDADWGAASLLTQQLIPAADAWCELADTLPRIARPARTSAILRTLRYEENLRRTI